MSLTRSIHQGIQLLQTTSVQLSRWWKVSEATGAILDFRKHSRCYRSPNDAQLCFHDIFFLWHGGSFLLRICLTMHLAWCEYMSMNRRRGYKWERMIALQLRRILLGIFAECWENAMLTNFLFGAYTISFCECIILSSYEFQGLTWKKSQRSKDQRYFNE